VEAKSRRAVKKGEESTVQKGKGSSEEGETAGGQVGETSGMTKRDRSDHQGNSDRKRGGGNAHAGEDRGLRSQIKAQG